MFSVPPQISPFRRLSRHSFRSRLHPLPTRSYHPSQQPHARRIRYYSCLLSSDLSPSYRPIPAIVTSYIAYLVFQNSNHLTVFPLSAAIDSSLLYRPFLLLTLPFSLPDDPSFFYGLKATTYLSFTHHKFSHAAYRFQFLLALFSHRLIRLPILACFVSHATIDFSFTIVIACLSEATVLLDIAPHLTASSLFSLNSESSYARLPLIQLFSNTSRPKQPFPFARPFESHSPFN